MTVTLSASGINWLAVVATHLFPGRTWKLILIDAGFYVVFFVIAGLIFGAWH